MNSRVRSWLAAGALAAALGVAVGCGAAVASADSGTADAVSSASGPAAPSRGTDAEHVGADDRPAPRTRGVTRDSEAQAASTRSRVARIAGQRSAPTGSVPDAGGSGADVLLGSAEPKATQPIGSGPETAASGDSTRQPLGVHRDGYAAAGDVPLEPVRMVEQRAADTMIRTPVEEIGGAVVDAILGVAQAFLPEPTVPPGSKVTIGHSTLTIPCGCDGTTVDALWYVPNQDTAPEGLVYLQHGFFRNNRAMSALAVEIAERTNSVVVAPTLSSNFLTGNGCWINGEPMQRAVAELFEGERTALTASAFAVGYAAPLPRRFVLSGHSAGGGLAVAVAALLRDDDDLAGVVMFDGVTSRERMFGAIAALPLDVQVLQIAAPPSPWNDDGAATAALVTSRPGQFVGVLLEGGTHIDSEGSSSDPLARLLVGTPRPANVAAVPVLAAQWITTLLDGGRVTGAPVHPVPGATAVPLQVAPRLQSMGLSRA